MGTVFEVFGYPLADKQPEAEEVRRSAWCPFMGQACDGGGNRHLSNVNLKTDPVLGKFFEGLDEVPAGICSLRPTPASEPWIVCPRRLLVLGREAAGERRRQGAIEELTIELLKFASGTRIGVWPELKIKVSDPDSEGTRRFDYTFDYVLMPLGRLGRSDEPGLDWHQAGLWESAGYRLEGEVVLDAPVGRPAVIEIMTSSTSGGNKKTGTTIPDAFRRSIIQGSGVEGPGINYRQVWARMASQLFVKSEVAAAWGGTALWVIQDVLANYISDTTALDLASLRATELSEINILSLSYGDDAQGATGVIELPNYELYAGAIGGDDADERGNGFLDIVRLGFKPRRSDLIGALLRRPPVNEILVV